MTAHTDSGARCCVLHVGKPQCIICSCGAHVQPDEWLAHIGQATKSAPVTETCATCRWFDAFRSENGAEGLCRKSVPAVAVDAEGNRHTLWPSVFEDDWCGEHTPKGEG